MFDLAIGGVPMENRCAACGGAGDRAELLAMIQRNGEEYIHRLMQYAAALEEAMHERS